MKSNHNQKTRWPRKDKEQSRFFWLVGGLFVLFIIIMILSALSSCQKESISLLYNGDIHSIEYLILTFFFNHL